MNAMKNGDHINQTEDRAVLHTALRCPKTEKRIVDGVDVVPEVHAVLEKIAVFSEKVRKGEWLGATGKKLTTVVAIGIGGSFLGPEFVYEALKTEKDGKLRLQACLHTFPDGKGYLITSTIPTLTPPPQFSIPCVMMTNKSS